MGVCGRSFHFFSRKKYKYILFTIELHHNYINLKHPANSYTIRSGASLNTGSEPSWIVSKRSLHLQNNSDTCSDEGKLIPVERLGCMVWYGMLWYGAKSSIASLPSDVSLLRVNWR